MTLRRAFAVLLTLLLLFTQHTAFAHVVAHASEKVPAKEQLAHAKLCGKCVNFEKLSHAAPGSAIAVVPLDLIYSQPTGARYFFRPCLVAAFRSRAPPVLV